MHFEDIDANVNDVLAISNHAESRGGGCFLDKRARMETSEVRYLDNHADGEGGGLYVGWGASVIATDCIFANNVARSMGGALFVASTEGVLLRGSNIELLPAPDEPQQLSGSLSYIAYLK